MKKTYFAPSCYMVSFDVADILTLSVGETPAKAGSLLDWNSDSNGYGFY